MPATYQWTPVTSEPRSSNHRANSAYTQTNAKVDGPSEFDWVIPLGLKSDKQLPFLSVMRHSSCIFTLHQRDGQVHSLQASSDGLVHQLPWGDRGMPRSRVDSHYEGRAVHRKTNAHEALAF